MNTFEYCDNKYFDKIIVYYLLFFICLMQNVFMQNFLKPSDKNFKNVHSKFPK